MDDSERDKMLIEISTDIKWLKAYFMEHKVLHSRYTLYFVTIVIGLVISLLQ